MDPWLWPYIILAVAAVSVTLFALYTMRRGEKEREEPREIPETGERWPFKAERTVTTEETRKAEKELKGLELINIYPKFMSK